MVAVDKHWKRLDPDPSTVERLCDALGCHPVAATLLANRGVTNGNRARRTLDPGLDELHDPFEMRGMDRAVDRLVEAVHADETVTVYADRDLDGVAGAAILTTLVSDLDVPVGYHIPGKYDGYGVHLDALRSLADRGTDVVITVDCGTTATDELAAAHRLGMDVIVADHHPPDGPIPEVHACLNPRRHDCAYPNDGLAAAAVAYKLGAALVDRSPELDHATYRDLGVVLAALATVSDRMPLTLENRAIVRNGYERISEAPLVGLRVATEECGVESMRDLGWSLVPRLNAAREHRSGHLLVRTLLVDERERARRLLAELEEYQEKRRDQQRAWLESLESRVTEQTDPTADDVLIVETAGYVGNAPGRLAERYGKPILTYYEKDGGYRGRVETATDLAIEDVMEACRDLLDSTWGHPDAPRFFVSSEAASRFIDRFLEEFRRRHAPEELRPTVEIDVAVAPAAVDRTLVDAIERLRPFGDGFDVPTLLIEGMELTEADRFGARDEHVALEPTNASCRCVWWGGWEAWRSRRGPDRHDVAGSVSWDGYRETATIHVADVRGHDVDAV